MPIDKTFIGKEYKPVYYVIGQEKIKEYALAIGDHNPLYLDSEVAKKSSYGCIIAPPMFVVVFAKECMDALFIDKELNINFARLLHGEQEFNFHKIVKSGDTVKSIGKIKNIFQKGNNDFVELETKSYNQHNELAVEGLWTFVIRG
jgi:acyl dehydratase